MAFWELLSGPTSDFFLLMVYGCFTQWFEYTGPGLVVDAPDDQWP